MQNRTKKLMPGFFLGVVAAIAFSACSQSNFAGSSEKKSNPKPKGSTATAVDTETPGVEISTVDGSIADCARGTMVEDPAATFAFQAGETTTFVNSLTTYTKIPTAKWNAGSVHHDKVTADKVCQLKGYVASESMTGRGYHSCHNNNHGYWSESAKNFEIKNACADNSSIITLVCKGKLKDLCEKDKSWVFDQVKATP